MSRLSFRLFIAAVLTLGATTALQAQKKGTGALELAPTQDKQLVIYSATTNRVSETITIRGVNFDGGTPQVQLQDFLLTVLSATPQEIVVYLPSAVGDGSYLMVVSKGTRSLDRDVFNVTCYQPGSQGRRDLRDRLVQRGRQARRDRQARQDRRGQRDRRVRRSAQVRRVRQGRQARRVKPVRRDQRVRQGRRVQRARRVLRVRLVQPVRRVQRVRRVPLVTTARRVRQAPRDPRGRLVRRGRPVRPVRRVRQVRRACRASRPCPRSRSRLRPT